jgi:hypothetical protein
VRLTLSDAGSTLRRVEAGVARSEFAIPTMYQEFTTPSRNLKTPGYPIQLQKE